MSCSGAAAGESHVAVRALVRLLPRVNVVVVRPVLLVRETLVAYLADEGLEVVLGMHRLLVPGEHLLGVGVAALLTLELFVHPHVALDCVRMLDDEVTAWLRAGDVVATVGIIDVVLQKK